jgi:kinesin family protein 13
MSVKVGVRVRPFNGREIELNCRLCVDMVGNTTRLLDLDDAKRNRDFSFDYSFWSHDEFTTSPTGYFEYRFF